MSNVVDFQEFKNEQIIKAVLEDFDKVFKDFDWFYLDNDKEED